MTEKIEITVTVPLKELVKVLRAVNHFGELLNDLDECIGASDLGEVANQANLNHGDGLGVISELPLFDQFFSDILGD